jgi:hypothetical protein
VSDVRRKGHDVTEPTLSEKVLALVDVLPADMELRRFSVRVVRRGQSSSTLIGSPQLHWSRTTWPKMPSLAIPVRAAMRS